MYADVALVSLENFGLIMTYRQRHPYCSEIALCWALSRHTLDFGDSQAPMMEFWNVGGCEVRRDYTDRIGD